jgi:vitamin B12 transporter
LKTPQDFFRFDLTYFDERLEDEINGFYFDPSLGDFGKFTALNTEGTSERNGVEVAGLFNFTADLSLYLAYTYLDARDPDNEIELRRPRHTASANLNYLFLAERGRVNLNVDYTGDQQDTDFSPPTYNTPVQLDSFTLVSLVVSYALIDNLEIYARGENLLDEEYQEVFGYAGNSRAGYLGIRYAWSK